MSNGGSPARPRIAIRCALSDAVLAEIDAFGDRCEDLAAADALIVNSGPRVDAALLEQAPNLRVVASTSVGYDNVDVDALNARGIPFSNTRGALTDAVADITHALIVMALRRIPQALAWAASGDWAARGAFPLSTDVESKTLGIVGMGEIGAAVAARARAAKMRVIYTNRKPRLDDAATGAAFAPLEKLLAQSDVVLALLPLDASTTRFFNAERFAAMKHGAIFVNAGRGALVDQDALLEALITGQLSRAALDVTDPEPLPPDHPLYAHADVIITPHIGSATNETRDRMALLALENVKAFVTGRPMPTRVN